MAGNTQPHALFHLRLIVRVALVAALGSLAGFSLLVLYLNYHAGLSDDYLSLQRAIMISQDQLGVATLLMALLLLLFTALTTGMIALYSTFRVAGPIYRFSRNLESAIYSGPGTMTPIRHTDELQQEAAALAAGFDTLRRHYDAFSASLDELEWAEERGDPPAVIASAIDQLMAVERRVRL